ncbi:MAG TPA: FxLYD domain-containing protein [Rhodospirillales bacterium]
MPEPEPEPAPQPAATLSPPTPEAGALSPEQLDEMFGDEPEPEAIQSLQDTGAGENVEDLNALEQLPEPEPIPQVFQTDAEDEAGAAEVEKGGMGKIIGIVAAVLVVAIIAGMFFGRGFIVGLWPGAAGIYAMVGLGGEELGAGLEIRDVTSARTVEGGVDALVVSGVVANVSKDDRQVPMLRVGLLDGSGVEVQHVVAAPLKNRLPAGQNIAFKAQLPEPSALARRLEVTFTKEDKPAAKKK